MLAFKKKYFQNTSLRSSKYRPDYGTPLGRSLNIRMVLGNDSQELIGVERLLELC